MSGRDSDIIEPIRRRAIVSEDRGEVRITVRARPLWDTVILSTVSVFALISWADQLVSRSLNPQLSGLERGVTVFGFLALSALTLTLLFLLLWCLFGRDTLTVSDASLTLEKRSPVYYQVRVYDLASVQGLRATPSRIDYGGACRRSYRELWTISDGLIAFESGARTHRCGTGMDFREAQYLVQLVSRRFPSLAPKEQP